MNIAIVGGTGTVGAEAARELAARGHTVRVLSRHAPEYPVDLTTGAGLETALAGIDVVIDAASGGKKVLVAGTERLLRAEAAAGVKHHVGVSIVGIDRVGGPYYKLKLAQEAAIRAGGVPWTIVRATQFHTLIAQVFAKSAKLGVVPSLGAPLQPVDPREVGRVLADTAEAEPALGITQFAGPEIVSARELARRWRAATGSHAVPVRLAGLARAALRRADRRHRPARHGDVRPVARRVTLAEQFEALRPRLLRIAYGQLGSVAEAEDVLQDAWLRLERVDTDAIRDLEGWLITTVSRLGLDALKSARVRREAYVGPWLPEPIVSADPGPEEVTLRRDEVSLALLVVLESLSASERTAFVLHDVFGYSFDEVAGALGSSSAAARQQAARARKAVEARRPRFPATPEQQREIIIAFGQAAAEGDMDGLLALLHPDAVLTSDGGGIVNAARKPVAGAERVAKAITASAGAAAQMAFVDVNGMPGLAGHGRDGIRSIVAFTIDDGRITRIDFQRNPEKLR